MQPRRTKRPLGFAAETPRARSKGGDSPEKRTAAEQTGVGDTPVNPLVRRSARSRGADVPASPAKLAAFPAGVRDARRN